MLRQWTALVAGGASLLSLIPNETNSIPCYLSPSAGPRSLIQKRGNVHNRGKWSRERKGNIGAKAIAFCRHLTLKKVEQNINKKGTQTNT